MSSNSASPGDNELAVSDLGPLAWVLDELRKSLDGATKAMRRFVRDAELARGSDLTELDASHLRIARQQLHQAVGALEMVGLAAPAKVVRAMEAVAQKFVQRPELCSDDAANKVERASFALIEYLEGVLKGKSASCVALFPQYRSVLDLVGAERVHPADLWAPEWRWEDVAAPAGVTALPYAPAVRARMDQAILKIVKTGDAAAGRRMVEICSGLANAQASLLPRSFWTIAAAYFESLSDKLIPEDVYTKRTASRILQQYATLAKGGTDISDRLAQDLTFYCSIAQAREDHPLPALHSVRSVYGLTGTKAVNYEVEQFGRYDPALLVLARKRIASAAETWSALAGGDANRLKMAAEQFASLADSVVKLHPECGDMARALLRAIDVTVQSGGAPSPAVAMEVATAVLYLEAAYEDLDPTESHMADRSARLAQRLEHVSAGGDPEQLEGWMEELYRRVSDRQTMGSVVDELRTNLTEVEKSLDQFFRNPHDKAPLREVPSQLAQMRGVFSVLGLDQPSLAALRMRSSVEQFLVDDIDEAAARSGIFDKLGNSLGAMGFLIDMLSYQRTLAKKLFVYDEELGEFKPLMGRERSEVQPQAPAARATLSTQAQSPAFVEPSAIPPVANVATVAPPVKAPHTAAPAMADDSDDDSELLDIFLDEAREVVQTGQSAIKALVGDPTNLADQTTLRRAFHTLKGSSRMVGLNEFGEAAWSYEQLMNSWLAEQRPASDDLVRATSTAMAAFGRWVEDIAAKTDTEWSAVEFRKASDALRLENQWVPLRTPAGVLIEETVAFQVDVVPVAVESELDLPVLEIPGAEGDEATEEALEMADFPPVELPSMAAEFGSELDPIVGQPDFGATQISELLGEPHGSTVTVLMDIGREEAAATNSLELGDFDFGEPADAVSTMAPVAAVEEADLVTQLPDFTQPPLDSELVEPATEELVKVIGTLRLSIPLYNVYLNEADEWSRRLQVELSEWAMELHRPMPDSLVALAHSLVGSSAAVGFNALSELARTLEHALQHVQLHGRGTPEHAQVFGNAAEDIRRLLHQFAAGFLKESDDTIVAALREIIETEFPAPTMEGDALLEDVAEPAPAVEVMEVPQAQLLDAELDLDAPLLDTQAELPQVALEAEPEPTAVVADAVAPAPEHIPEPTPVDEVPVLEIVAGPQPALQLPVEALAGLSVAAAPLHIAESVDDDIDAVDNLDEDLFPIFEEEGAELMPLLGAALRQWVAEPEKLSARNEVLRVLHTLKGSARLAGAMRLGEMTHRMESNIEYIGSESLQAVQLEPLLTRFDALQAAFAALGAPVAAEPVTSVAPVAAVAVDAPVSADGAVKPVVRLVPMAAAPMALQVRPVSNQSVRVRSQLLDRLVNQAGEVMITRSRMDARLTQLRASLGELTGNLDRLRQQLRDVEVQAESQMQSRLAQTKDTAQAFDPLEFDRFTRVQELTRMMAESVNDVATVQRNLQRSIEGTEDDLIAQGRQARELQRDLLKTRMVEFEAISERLYGVVRQASKDAGKAVKLDIVGGSIEMDRGVLDRMTPSFEHMLRNAVAHGIESADVRTQGGKSAIGTITIQVNQESNDVSVTFRDDGGGLHLGKIRAKAIANGVISSNDALTDDDAANLIFTAGFSTADQITELSGRGVGMDVVRSEVSSLGGRIETSTVLGAGTNFKLVLPLTTAVTQVVMMRMGEFTIGVPSNLMETVLRVPAAALEQAYERDGFEFGGQVLPFFWAGALLQVSSRSHEMKTRTMPAVVMRSAGQRLVLHVDEVLGNREVVVKNLGPQLARLPGLAGVSVLASGAVVLIYNPVALATVYGAQARQLYVSPAAAAELEKSGGIAASMSMTPDQLPLVLVVDDSITVRRVTQRLLKREGYRVVLAADGLQALEKLQEEKPAVVLSDIEMPRMDGFDLARNIRADERLRDLPIIMITSRIAEKHREHAKALGVDHYLGKPYSEDELMGLVRSYCALPQPA